MDVLGFCLCALGIGLLVSIIRQQNKDIAPAAVAAASVIILSALLKYAVPLLDEVYALSSTLGNAKVYITVMVKAFGIALTSKTCAEVCRDCGEGSVAAKIESAGKIGILLLALPVLKTILAMLEDLIK